MKYIPIGKPPDFGILFLGFLFGPPGTWAINSLLFVFFVSYSYVCMLHLIIGSRQARRFTVITKPNSSEGQPDYVRFA